MWYLPYLRVKRAMRAYGLTIGIITLIAIALKFTSIPGPHSAHDPHFAERIHFDIVNIVMGSALIVAFLASILGLNLASENDGHLELAWTKPVSREQYALTIFTVDAVAIVIALLATIFCGVLISDVWIGHQAVEVSGSSGWEDVLAILFPINIYAWIVALTASQKRNRGGFVGMFWPAAFMLAALPQIPVDLVQRISRVIDYVNPIVLFTKNSRQQPTIASYEIAFVMTVVLLVVAIAQWRRLEA